MFISGQFIQLQDVDDFKMRKAEERIKNYPEKLALLNSIKKDRLLAKKIWLKYKQESK